MIVNYGFGDSRYGVCFVATDLQGAICYLGFSNDLAYLQNRMPFAEEFRRIDVQELVNSIFDDGSAQSEVSVPLRLIGTDFQIRVWNALLEVPCGERLSYSALAARIGMPKAVRATATAVARNPVSYIVPCHRVVRRDGTLGNYHWGVSVKRAILEDEYERAQCDAKSPHDLESR